MKLSEVFDEICEGNWNGKLCAEYKGKKYKVDVLESHEDLDTMDFILNNDRDAENDFGQLHRDYGEFTSDDFANYQLLTEDGDVVPPREYMSLLMKFEYGEVIMVIE